MTLAEPKTKVAAVPTNDWNEDECGTRMRFRFDDGSFYEQRLVSQYLDSEFKHGATFSLYYFVKDQTYDLYERDEDKPTILFVAGGPGQIILPDTENFVDMYGYRTVYFHLRGSGFSQIPLNADRFLRTFYVVEDLEKIRDDLQVTQWTAVIGHSYGSVVVQEYAKQHGAYVKKIILSAPMAPMTALSTENGREKPKDKKIESQVFLSLERIYERSELEFLDGKGLRKRLGYDPKKFVVERAEEIATAVADRYWSVQHAGESYKKLKQELAADDLDYGVAFFGAIRRLRHVGWLPLDVPYLKPIKTPKVDDTQLQCALVIAKAILLKDKKIDLTKLIKSRIVKEVLGDGEALLSGQSSQNTARPYYVISYHDGLEDKFFRNTKKFFRSNVSLAKLGATSSPGKPWDPKKYKHDKPTLILKGGADPVTEQGEAEYYLKQGLGREAILIEFPGVGHSLALPDLRSASPKVLKNAVTTHGKNETTRILSTRDTLIDAFLNAKSMADFEKAPIIGALKKAFEPESLVVTPN